MTSRRCFELYVVNNEEAFFGFCSIGQHGVQIKASAQSDRARKSACFAAVGQMDVLLSGLPLNKLFHT
jgi:hypothetical protein